VVRTFPVSRQVNGMIPGATPILPAEFVPARYVIDSEALPVAHPEPLRRPPQRVASIRKQAGDICARHNMVKQITRGGKSWRCRR
jgi:hypothetical protein